jgi:hypothetical protein
MKLGEEWPTDMTAESDRAPNILTFTSDKATRRREMKRFKAYHRRCLVMALLNGSKT